MIASVHRSGRALAPRDAAGLLPVESVDRVDDVTLVLFRQFGIDRQRQGLVRGRLGVGEGAAGVSECGEAALEMERDRIVDLGPDPPVRQAGTERVAERRRDPDDELIVYV